MKVRREGREGRKYHLLHDLRFVDRYYGLRLLSRSGVAPGRGGIVGAIRGGKELDGCRVVLGDLSEEGRSVPRCLVYVRDLHRGYSLGEPSLTNEGRRRVDWLSYSTPQERMFNSQSRQASRRCLFHYSLLPRLHQGAHSAAGS